MNRTATDQKRTRTAPATDARRSLHPAFMRVGLLLLSVLLLSLALAPVNQYYLAWVGLAPWMLAVAQTRSKKAAFGWGFAGAWAFFLVNMWWLWFVTPPGMFVLTLYLAFFWGVAAIIVRGLLRPPLPPGEGWGEGALATIDSRRRSPPHPNPLPEGEGTRRSALLTVLLIPVL